VNVCDRYELILDLETAKLIVDDVPDNLVRSHSNCFLEEQSGCTVSEYAVSFRNVGTQFVDCRARKNSNRGQAMQGSSQQRKLGAAIDISRVHECDR
jgi:hypothetical protein